MHSQESLGIRFMALSQPRRIYHRRLSNQRGGTVGLFPNRTKIDEGCGMPENMYEITRLLYIISFIISVAFALMYLVNTLLSPLRKWLGHIFLTSSLLVPIAYCFVIAILYSPNCVADADVTPILAGQAHSLFLQFLLNGCIVLAITGLLTPIIALILKRKEI